MKTLTDEQAKYLKTIPVKYQNIFRRAYTTNSKADAIKANCLQCTNFPCIHTIHIAHSS